MYSFRLARLQVKDARGAQGVVRLSKEYTKAMAKGDHIKVWRAGGLYAHHGIDMGDGTVVHFSGEPLRTREACVCRTDMATFLRGARPIVVHHAGCDRSPEAVVAAAEAQLSKADYCLWRNNCEHFATYCKTGKRRSQQVLRAIGFVGSIAISTVAVVAYRTVLQRRKFT